MNNTTLNRLKDQGFNFLGLFVVIICLGVLVLFLGTILFKGLERVSWEFLVSLPSRFPEKAGILTAWTGTLWIFVLTALISIPLGVSAGIYLEEYAKKGWLSNILEINITNLAGVPSVIYGILGLEIFVRLLNFGGTLLAGSFTLSLLILPIIIVSTRESLRAVPHSLRQASFALGASKWQTIWLQVLPAASGSIMTGIILALSRAVGETAPLIVIGALAYVPFVAESPMDQFTVLPMQIFNWVSRPQEGFVTAAAAAIIVLLFIVFLLNGIAVFIRHRSQQKFQS
jgi:phosphate transport system permease protein